MMLNLNIKFDYDNSDRLYTYDAIIMLNTDTVLIPKMCLCWQYLGSGGRPMFTEDRDWVQYQV